MTTQNIFPTQALSIGMSDSSVKLEGQKVMFDKKVSLLPADISKAELTEIKATHGKHGRQRKP